VEQCDKPGNIVMNPATEYVAKFTEDIDKARVVHASDLMSATDATVPDGEPVPAAATVQDLARRLVDDLSPRLPVADETGAVVGVLNRDAALNVLLGTA